MVIHMFTSNYDTYLIKVKKKNYKFSFHCINTLQQCIIIRTHDMNVVWDMDMLYMSSEIHGYVFLMLCIKKF